MILLLKLCFNKHYYFFLNTYEERKISAMKRASRGVWWETNSHFTSNSLQAAKTLRGGTKPLEHPATGESSPGTHFTSARLTTTGIHHVYKRSEYRVGNPLLNGLDLKWDKRVARSLSSLSLSFDDLNSFSHFCSRWFYKNTCWQCSCYTLEIVSFVCWASLDKLLFVLSILSHF